MPKVQFSTYLSIDIPFLKHYDFIKRTGYFTGYNKVALQL